MSVILLILIAALSADGTDIDYILGEEIYQRLEELSIISDEIGIISRPSLSNCQIQAADLIKSWMVDAGFDVHYDVVGNVVGRVESTSFSNDNNHNKQCQNDAKTLSIGSHYDSVRNAGRFDGTLGIVAAIAVVKAIKLNKHNIPFGIEVIAFEEEEGHNSFDLHFIGSQFYSGTLSMEYPTIIDDLFNIFSQTENITYFDKLSKHYSIMNGYNDIISKQDLFNQIIDQASKPRRDIFGFIELHIEQGPVLEDKDLPIGVVTSINGLTALYFEVYGKAGHAGTVPMNLRHDALVDVAQIVVFINNLAKSKKDLVITVGSMDVFPGSSNVIPSKVTFSIDLRMSINKERYVTVEQVFEFMEENKYNYTLLSRTDVNGVLLTPSTFLVKHLMNATYKYGSFMLPSGALHDGSIMSRITNCAMLFTRCRDGISHNPKEFVTLKDITISAKTLYKSVLLISNDYIS